MGKGKWKGDRGRGRDKEGGDALGGSDNLRSGDQRVGRGQWDTPQENARFESFYKAQGFVADGDDWDAMMRQLRIPLPASFRLNSEYAFVGQLRDQLMSFVGKTIEVDGVVIEPVQNLKWLPNGYKLGTDRRFLRKQPALQDLHQWMMKHTENGNITRQEAVSMVPPLVLDVHPHHKVLDMCAAPGSKTSQLLEIISKSEGRPYNEQGVVVANDSDTERAYMLVHQCRRISSPLLVVTTHKGQHMPKLYEDKAAIDAGAKGHYPGYFDRILCDIPCSGDGTLRKNPAIWGKWSTSSGFTLHPLQLMIARRGIQLLKVNGLITYSTCSLSPYENEAVVAELLRSHRGTLELVDARQFIPHFKARPGLNSWYVLDDKNAIVSASKRSKKNAAGKQQQDSANQGDDMGDGQSNETSNQAPEVSINKRIHSNPLVEACLQMGMQLYESFEQVPVHLQKKIRKSMFPPTADEREWMGLEKCLRCVPHDEDTGGFFVATFRKISEDNANAASAEVSAHTTSSTTDSILAPPDAENEMDATDGNVGGEEEKDQDQDAINELGDAIEEDGTSKKRKLDSDGNSKPAEREKSKASLVDFEQWDSVAFDKLASFYGFRDTLRVEHMFVREDKMASNAGNHKLDSSKFVYYIPPSVRNIIEGDINPDRLKIVTAGMKCLERKVSASGITDYRIIQEALHLIVPHVTQRKVPLKIQDFCNLLEGGLVSFSTLHPDTVTALTSIAPGAIICTYTFSSDDMIPSESDVDGTPTGIVDFNASAGRGGLNFHAVCWRGNSRTINVMCCKSDIEFMKHQLTALKVFRPKLKISDATGVPSATTVSKTEVPVSETPETEIKDVEVSISTEETMEEQN